MSFFFKRFCLLALSCFSLIFFVNAYAKEGDQTEFPFGERSIFSDRAIEARIQPSGEVCMQGEPCASGVAAVGGGAAEVAQRTPKEIYDTKCSSCHVAGVAGAPKFGDVAVWSARVQDKGLDQLVSNAIKGINAMPAMGLCMDCSEDDIKATVEYMVDAAK